MRKIILLIFCLTTALSQAQDSLSVAGRVPLHAVRFSPFHLFGFYPTVQLGYEFRMYNRWTLYLEGGYALDYQVDNSEFADKRGFKLKVEPRFYLTTNRKGSVLTYAAAELYYNHINYDRAEERVECFDGDCEHLFRRAYTYKGKYREHGFAPKWGVMFMMNDFFFDLNTGWAIRFVDYTNPSFVDEFMMDDIGWQVPNETDRVGLMPVLGVRMGYRFK